MMYLFWFLFALHVTVWFDDFGPFKGFLPWDGRWTWFPPRSWLAAFAYAGLPVWFLFHVLVA